MVEPFMSSRVDGKVRNDLCPDAVIKSIHIGQGLGSDLGLHLDEAAGGRRNGPRDGRHDDADAAARRRPDRSRRGVRQLGEGAGAAVGARPHRRPHPALPADDDVAVGRRHRSVDGDA